MRSQSTQHLRQGTLVRFSVGLEAVQDLQNDLQQAMERAFTQ
jgi:cystathionine beta-lyase